MNSSSTSLSHHSTKPDNLSHIPEADPDLNNTSVTNSTPVTSTPPKEGPSPATSHYEPALTQPTENLSSSACCQGRDIAVSALSKDLGGLRRDVAQLRSELSNFRCGSKSPSTSCPASQPTPESTESCFLYQSTFTN